MMRNNNHLSQTVTWVYHILAHNQYIHKNTNNLQFDQTGEALEDVYIETADAVVGQVSVKKNTQEKENFGFISRFRHNTTWQLQRPSSSKAALKPGGNEQDKSWQSDRIKENW